MTALDDALAPYGLRLYREAILVDDAALDDAIRVESQRLAAEFNREIFGSRDGTVPVDGSQLFAETWDTARSRPVDPEWFHENVEVGRFSFHTEPLHPKITVAPAHHGYDAIVTIAVMPLPPQPEPYNGDVVAWTAYILAAERRGHARALLDGICEGVWEQ